MERNRAALENSIPVSFEDFMSAVYKAAEKKRKGCNAIWEEKQEKALHNYLCSEEVAQEIRLQYNSARSAFIADRISGTVFQTEIISGVAELLLLKYEDRISEKDAAVEQFVHQFIEQEENK